jgi:hypothetical protein
LPPEIARQPEVDARTRVAPPDPDQRAGARVYKETPDSRSDREQYHNELVEEAGAGDIGDAIENGYNIVHAGLGIVRPTGQHTEPARGNHPAHQQSSAGSADPVMGLAAGLAMIGEAARIMGKRKKKEAEKRHGNG